MSATSRTPATTETFGRRGFADYLTEATVGSRRLNRAFVAQLAETRGWRTTNEIAAGLGINRSTYFRMLRGDHQPLRDTADSMAALADVTVDELFLPEQATPEQAA
jgi:DNA-binding XRE family transcriptional regulator